MKEITPADLVDYAAIAAFEDQIKAESSRQAKAATDHAKAELEHAAAVSTHAAAVGGNGDPLLTGECLEAAKRKLTIRRDVLDASRDALAALRRRGPIVQALACKPVYAEGILRCVAAARVRDEAKAMMEKGDKMYAEGREWLRYAKAQGLPDMYGSSDTTQPTEAAERALWISVGIDPSNPVHPWRPE